MSTEFRTSTHGSKSRRKLVVAAVLAALALLTTGAVAYWSSDSWSEQAMASGGFPGLPGGDWASTSTDDGWGSPDAADPTSATGTPGAPAQPTTSRPAATGVVDPASAPTSSVPTVAAPAPSPSRATTAPAPTSTAAPSPTRGNSKPKPTSTKKPRPTPSPSPTTSSGGCVLLIICH